MDTMPMCKYCGARPATEGVYCAECDIEIIGDMMKRDITEAYEDGVITTEEYFFIFGPTTTPLTDADIERFNEIMKKIDN